MTNGIFKRSGGFSYARSAIVMSTQSASGFEWTVKLIGTWHLVVGIASKLNEPGTAIYDYDQEAILYYSGNFSPDIRRGSTSIHSSLGTPQSGDVIRFKFQPNIKKLIIYWVRVLV